MNINERAEISHEFAAMEFTKALVYYRSADHINDFSALKAAIKSRYPFNIKKLRDRDLYFFAAGWYTMLYDLEYLLKELAEKPNGSDTDTDGNAAD